MVADTTADEGISEVREHIEKVVETLVGDNLDQTSVLKLVNHSSCKIQLFHAWHYKFFDLKTCFADDRIFILFHRNLSDALTQLAQAIYAVLSRKIFSVWCNQVEWKYHILFTDHSTDRGKTPTEAHSGLKHLIDALVEEIRDDSSFKVSFQNNELWRVNNCKWDWILHASVWILKAAACQCPSDATTYRVRT